MAFQLVSAMDEVIPGLWIGSIRAVSDVDTLRKHNIHSVLSAMRGRVKVAETFTHFQIQLDDTEDSDALAFFPQCISFIENELDRGRGVLVHCQAGMSRSATIVAAYLMYARQLNAQEALDLVVNARPSTQPNEGFLAQLEIFYEASYKVERRNKAMRMYYLERALDEIMNGDGTLSATSAAMLANFPRSPSDSLPTTPGGSAYMTAPSPPRGPRRRIRCKMCRTELAAREHMLDHGQVGPETPATAGISPIASRRPSTSIPERALPPGMTPLTPLQAVSRRDSSTGDRPLAPLATLNGEPISVPVRRLSNTRSLPGSGPASRAASFTLSTVPESARRPSFLNRELSTRTIREGEVLEDDSAIDDDDDDDDDAAKEVEAEPAAVPKEPPKPLSRSGSTRKPPGGIPFMTPMDLAAQLNVHPKLAALRSPGIGGIGGLQPMSPLSSGSVTAGGDVAVGTPPASAGSTLGVAAGGPASTMARMAAASQVPPLINNSACSGYFVEPMKWMEPFLEPGELAGKIICPNKKCGAKLGNYDWAGVCCSCKEWVTPGFCIHRSKVDEIIV